MKLGEVYRFELGQQLRRAWYWLMFLALLVVSFLMTRDGSLSEALREDIFVNSPFSLAKVAVVGGMLWLVMAGAVAGEAAARDRATGLHPLLYTTPLSRRAYLGGRFLAALTLNALLLLAVPLAALLAVHAGGMDPVVVGPFRPEAYLANYAFLSLANVLFVTAIQFALALRSGRPMVAYVGSFLLVFTGFFIASLLLFNQGWGRILDPVGVRFILDEMSHMWTTYEKSWRLVTLEGGVLWNRLFWLGVGAVAMSLASWRFRFGHPAEDARRWGPVRRRRLRSAEEASVTPGRGVREAAPVTVPAAARTFSFAWQARSALAVAGASFRSMATSWAGIATLTVIPLFTVLLIADQMAASGASLLPNTVLVLRELTGPLSDELSRWIFVPFVIVFFAGELVWREREAEMAEITDAMPGSDWAPLTGKVLGLAGFLVLFLALLMAAGMASQALLEYPRFEPWLYVRGLFGLQLTEYLLFVPLALAVHVVASHKYVGHLVAVMLYVVIVLAPVFGIHHPMLIYGAGPTWRYTYLQGFGASLGPWLAFKLYWAAWALVLLVVARLFWLRGREAGTRVRVLNARRRLQGSTLALAGGATALVLVLGGIVFYNTNVLHTYRSPDEQAALQAEYERRFGQYRDAPQPHLTAARLRVELDPEARAVVVRGSYTLVNRTGAAIDSLHVSPVPGVETRALTFDRPVTPELSGGPLPHGIHVLTEPLQPGDSVRLQFDVRVAARGFSAGGHEVPVAQEASSFDVRQWLPLLGYQTAFELTSPTDRREYGLPPRPLVAALEDAEVRVDRGPGVVLEIVAGTAGDQVPVAPGRLLESWEEGGRSYARFLTDGPVGSEWTVLSADYAVREARWEDPSGIHPPVDVRIYHHPEHVRNLESMERGIRASLSTYTEAFGPYPYGHLTFAEVPAPGTGMHAASSMVTFTEGTTFMRPPSDPGRLDFHRAVVAHEMGHQWTVAAAHVQGAPILSESLAWYDAFLVVEREDPDHLRQLLEIMHRPYPHPQIRRGEPLLRGVDPYMAYRRGPFALHALTEYLGTDAVNGALRAVFEAHDGEGAPLATTLDLYRELQAVAPDSLVYLVHDLFAVNAFWELDAESATARETADGTWEVSVEVLARKVVADSTGAETEVPLDEWIEVAVFGARTERWDELSNPLHVGRHRIHSGRQTITLTVSERPVLAGVDPYHVLDWVANEDDDNIVGVGVGGG